jgi:ATP-dependent DNA helicase RecG
MKLQDSVAQLKGVGVVQAQKLAVLGLSTVTELINYYPRRYDDYSQIVPISQLKPGPVTLEVVIKQAKGRYARRGMHVTEAVASDKTGSVRLIWFNQPYREQSMQAGKPYYVTGQYELSRQRFSLLNPSLELVSDFPVNTARIIPIYRETKGLTSRNIRQLLLQTLPVIRRLPETLPAWIVQEQKLLSRAEAMEAIHFPATQVQLQAAQRRLGFEEVFRLTLASLLNKQANGQETGQIIPFDKKLAQSFVKKLPFSLTDDQRRVIWQIYLDLQKSQPMNRLVEGDVGSGKTVVAVMAALMAIADGWQVALMAPTELLARQHADTIAALLNPLALEQTLTLLVGSMKPAQKQLARQALSTGLAQFVVGTHAVIQDRVDIHKLALIIIDEQHRFGVEQRKALQAKAGRMPHVLNLTATPIPRSLALTLYGELDISVLAHKPAGRQPIITEIVAPAARARLYKQLDQELAAGRQMFVVCPLISESTLIAVNSAEQVYEELRKGPFKHRRIGLLHGKLKSVDKNRVMQQFVDHKLDILVSTTVIEVGVDVPNASIMLIEAAERFGLAQIHQLRGRVGRSTHQGYCYLLLSDARPPGRRLRALESSSDGFRLAELDLELRGPGAIYGEMQHGQLDLRIAKLSDTKLIAAARSSAQAFLDHGESLLQYKELAAHVTRLRTITNLN